MKLSDVKYGEPARIYDDDRARRNADVFGPLIEADSMKGDINISFIPKDRLVAWHRHQKQWDIWHVVKGALKVGLLDESGEHKWAYLSEWNRRTLAVPPGVWHGYLSLGPEETVLIYYITNHYDPDNPDEERMSVEQAGIDWTVPIR